MQTLFAPTVEAALERLRAVQPARYAATRNALDGAVTALSPYFTHGLLDLPQALEQVASRHPLGPEHKLVMEFGWREFFAHVWRHRGEAIFSDLRPPLPGVAYSAVLPEDIRTASTGVAAIDAAVRQLYATGYLHNHARLWLASYVVHLRKVHWRTGADWLYGHLLDGDLASNHLSWQWVAGTFSVKPYLFNARNVARYAPADWHSPGTAIDTSYEALDTLARQAVDVGPEAQRPAPTPEPPLLTMPTAQPHLALQSLPEKLPARVELVHPWMLGEAAENGALRIGVVHLPFHQRFAWSARRWQFVLTRMAACTQAQFVGDLHLLQPRLLASEVTSRSTDNPGYAEQLAAMVKRLEPIPRFLAEPPRFCQSFSKFYSVAQGSDQRRGTAGRWHQ